MLQFYAAKCLGIRCNARKAAKIFIANLTCYSVVQQQCKIQAEVGCAKPNEQFNNQVRIITMNDSFIKHETWINIFYIHTSHSHKLHKTTDKLKITRNVSLIL